MRAGSFTCTRTVTSSFDAAIASILLFLVTRIRNPEEKRYRYAQVLPGCALVSNFESKAGTWRGSLVFFNNSEIPKKGHACPSINKSTERHRRAPYCSLPFIPPQQFALLPAPEAYDLEQVRSQVRFASAYVDYLSLRVRLGMRRKLRSTFSR